MPLSQEDRDAIDPIGARERQAVENATIVSEELDELNPNTEMDAKEFGEHEKNGDWRLGLLVARNVADDHGEKPWEAEGISRATWYRQNETDAQNCASVSKISARAFARQAGLSTGGNTVTKYLKAWNMAAADGLIPASSSLVPGQNVSFSGTDDDGKPLFTQKTWDHYFKPPAGDNEKTVDSVLINPIDKLVNVPLRDWICTEQYDGTENVIDTAYAAFGSMISKGYEGLALCKEVAAELGMEIND